MKPKVRLMQLGDCPNGTRFWTRSLLYPNTLIVNSFKKGESIYHSGHAFNIKPLRKRVNSKMLVWAITNGVY
ncbi:hypothetical protein AH03_11 [Erwinia phage AH03]|uniref:Uncharacterized protein n=1 Tax=Erwinia phage AH03 TaxID=2869568 RepID=A0AAE8BQ00_9CAUD|nr:hypothetical protein AH03_11 [Erwinia phage AH03]